MTRNSARRKPLWTWVLVLLLFGMAGGIVRINAKHPNLYFNAYYGHELRTRIDGFQSGFWPVFGICFVAVAIGRLARFLARGDECPHAVETEAGESPPDGSNSRRRFQFSLFRLLLATTICAVVFGLSRMYFGRVPPIYYWSSAAIACALAVMVLVVRQRHFARIAMSVLLGLFGAITGFALKSLLTAPSTRLETIEDDLYVVVPSVIVFSVIGCLLSRWDERIQRNRRK